MLPLRFARRLELSDCEEGKLHKFTHTWQFCNEVILHSLNYWTRTAQTDVCLWQCCARQHRLCPASKCKHNVHLPQLCFIGVRYSLYVCNNKGQIMLLWKRESKYKAIYNAVQSLKRIWIVIIIFSRLVLQNLVLETESTFPLVFALCCFTVNFQKAHKMEMWPHSECFTQWKAQGQLRLRAHLFHVWGQQFRTTSDGCGITTETWTHTVLSVSADLFCLL